TQFSQSATAAVGGDIGWVRPDQLPPELAKAAAQLKPGELSAPIRTAGGYYLLLVVDRRTGSSGGDQGEVFDIVQVVFALPAQASEAQRRTALAEAEAVRGAAKDCPTMLKIGKEKAPQLSSEGKLAANQIAPEMRKLVEAMQVGQVSQPIVQKNGVGVIMLCGKSNTGVAGVTRDDVGETILTGSRRARRGSAGMSRSSSSRRRRTLSRVSPRRCRWCRPTARSARCRAAPTRPTALW